MTWHGSVSHRSSGSAACGIRTRTAWSTTPRWTAWTSPSMEGEKVAHCSARTVQARRRLLLHLNGLLQRRAGKWRCSVEASSNADKAALARIRARVGLIFQDPDDQLFSNTVAEDVAFGPDPHGPWYEAKSEQRVDSAMADVGLPGFGDRAPYHLSGGEKRQISHRHRAVDAAGDHRR